MEVKTTEVKTTEAKTMHAAIVVTGAISDIYLKNMTSRFSILKVDAICANHMEHAEKRRNNMASRL